ncbi:MAG: hypothetical protein HQL56_10035 [Magnetococcales bacterium]|nr:hypothetical protein [Magnetococcales bacterium]
MGERAFRILLLLLLVGGLAMRVWLAQPPIGSDDIGYLQRAFPIADAVESQAPVQHEASLRLAMTLLQRLPGTLLGSGYSITSFYSALALQSLLLAGGFLAFAWQASRSRSIVLLVMLFWATSYAAISTEGTLTPDAPGTALALLGLACLLAHGGFHGEEVSARKPLYWGLLAGVLLYGAFSVRGSFAPFVLAGLFAAAMAPARRRLLPGLILGLSLGLLLEAVTIGFQYGNPFLRFDLLLHYRGGGIKGTALDVEDLTEADASTVKVLLGLALRFPRMLINSGSGEIFLFVLGLGGALLWLGRCRRPLPRINLLLLGLVFGSLAFAVKGLHPPRPLLREGMRYYLTAAPLFYLAAAEGLLFLVERLRSRPWLGRGVLLGGFGLALFNLWIISQSPHLLKNGNDGLSSALSEAARAGAAGGPRLYYGDKPEMARLFLADDWRLQKRFQAFPEPGFLLLNWRFRNFLAGQRQESHLFTLQGLIETHAFVYRHRNRYWQVDLFQVEPQSTGRLLTPGPALHRFGLWKGGSETLLSDMNQPVRLESGQLLASDAGDWQRPSSPGRPLAAGLWQVRLMARVIRGQPMLRPMLWVWKTPQETPRVAVMGESAADGDWQEVRLWSWLPEAMADSRLIVRLEGGQAEVREVALRHLGALPGDRMQHAGGEWLISPEKVPK